MPPKRPAAKAIATGATKRRRGAAVGVGGGRRGVRVKGESDATASAAPPISDTDAMREEFINLLTHHPEYKNQGISNAGLKQHFGDARYPKLVPIINELTKSSRLTMTRGGLDGKEMFFSIVSMEDASKFEGLDASARMVYRVVESAGNRGIWTVDIRIRTSLQSAQLTKMFKQLESRRLIKPIKSVTAKTKKLYMLYDLTPAKEITGGPWYSEYEWDHEFVSEMRNFILMCVKRMNRGKGVTLKAIADKMTQANVSRVKLNLEEVQQLVQTLAFDYLIEQRGVNESGEATFVSAKKISSMCEFRWWDVLDDNFHFRGIHFEDGVYLSAHEPHHHT